MIVDKKKQNENERSPLKVIIENVVCILLELIMQVDSNVVFTI